MADFSFRDLDLDEAERELVGACIDYEHALRTALRLLPVDDFRSHRADELRRIFYVVAGWLDKGEYDELENRYRLQELWPDVNLADYECLAGAVPEYVEALCMAIVESNRLMDAVLDARRRWRETNPLRISVPATPQPVAPIRGPRGKGGFVGGINV